MVNHPAHFTPFAVHCSFVICCKLTTFFSIATHRKPTYYVNIAKVSVF
ncbi:hypothetical protein HMPREF1991_02070 [Hoylesella loescheii DSM 19665 = JCM 12249 = ATCC 15930]|uniref:Uncharacterized protein n=1 Tax=Hoylesella loescheii DSM 19665 = JCM 12249 = ATCC 15930 TaxID=1122985 RepID=A0A069QIH5_HOYLO|nr:hypothetical protein HMPREF1991_02070 [Hoylesella loescheii DSM 19665 = JCM 12249 = ATCC 15930]